MTTTTHHLIARMLAATGAPMDAAAVAEAAGIHVTTARFHLDRLVETGEADRAPLAGGARGRPRVGYTAAAAVRAEPARATMVSVLADALGAAPDGPSRARAAGREWADALGGAGDLVDVLERLGFAPAREERGIRLRACPFLDAARVHPEIVCQVHRGIIERVVEPDADVRLVPFDAPSGCLVSL
jgi:predicted ArsR family transcriptional regulator